MQGLHEANEWKNNKDKVLPVTKASRKRVVISDESGEEEEVSIQDSDQDRETSKSSKSKNTTKSNGNAKRIKEPIEVDSADEVRIPTTSLFDLTTCFCNYRVITAGPKMILSQASQSPRRY